MHPVLLIAANIAGRLLESRKEASTPEGATVCIDSIVSRLAYETVMAKIGVVEVGCNVLAGLCKALAMVQEASTTTNTTVDHEGRPEWMGHGTLMTSTNTPR